MVFVAKVLGLFAGACALTMIGCVERDPFTANDFEEHRVQPRRERVVVAEADPAAVCVTTPPSDVPIIPAEEAEPVRSRGRLRETVSLGYAGDGPLTQVPSQQGGFYGSGQPAGYRGFGYGGGYARGYGGGRGARSSSQQTTQGAGGNSAGSGGGLHSSGGGPSQGAGGRGGGSGGGGGGGGRGR